MPTSDHSGSAAILGYLNFSNGRPDAAVQRAFNEYFAQQQPGSWEDLAAHLEEELRALSQRQESFADASQARTVVGLVFFALRRAYLRHHADLLFHVTERELLQPFFVARMCEAVLSAGPPWEEVDRIVGAALSQLNDFLGWRPLPVLENDRTAEPYEHERHRPLPLYLQEAGVGVGRYHDLIAAALDQLHQSPLSLREAAGFEIERMDELAVDLRSYDALHPVFKRTNYLFGEWDPHCLDNEGYYRRFVLRRMHLESLQRWVEQGAEEPRRERLYDASAVLAATILMASAVTGWGPAAYGSDVSLATLLPEIAHQRDEFYARLMERVSGRRGKRLARILKQTQQPMGHVRHQLNFYLASYSADQMRRRVVAEQYARIGFPEAARGEASRLPSTSMRMGTEIAIGIETAERAARGGSPAAGREELERAFDLLVRGIECGAFLDPWNILGFQGQCPLSPAREDTIPDSRLEWLIETVDRLFAAGRRLLTEAAASGLEEVYRGIEDWLGRFARWWDRYATTVVQDVPSVNGGELLATARAVAATIAEWRAARHAAGDLSFWRDRLERLETPQAFVDVVEALLERNDPVAASGLLVGWISQAEQIGLGEGTGSFFHLAVRWMQTVTGPDSAIPAPEQAQMVRRFLDFLEANAGEFWSVPYFGESPTDGGMPDETAADLTSPGGEWDDEDPEEWTGEDLYEAAYDDFVFRESSADGNEGGLLEGGSPESGGEFEEALRELMPRVQFLEMLGTLWRIAAGRIGGDAEFLEAARNWQRQADQFRLGLIRMDQAVCDAPVQADVGYATPSSGDYDMKLQMKNQLIYVVSSAAVQVTTSELLLRARIGGDSDRNDPVLAVLRGILDDDAERVARSLPKLFRALSGSGLLYTAVEHGGDPIQAVAARGRYELLAILASELPRLGLLQQSRELVQAVLRLERKSRPQGSSVTEFDQIYRISLRTVLEVAILAGSGGRAGDREDRRRKRRAEWRLRLYHDPAPRKRGPLRGRGRRPRRSRRALRRQAQDRQTVNLVALLLENLLTPWLRHAKTLRLSAIEEFNTAQFWRQVTAFIHRYGGELFHARHLPLGNLRAILHDGVDQFLEVLVENDDPLHPAPLVAALEEDPNLWFETERILDSIYSAVVDEMERFVEYNSTTTHSDYGERFDIFLDFVRTEAAYRRDEWALAPLRLAHAELAKADRGNAARLWAAIVRARTSESADRHLARLKRLEKRYAMRMPTITDHLEERFVKPFAIDRILALVPAAVRESELRHTRPRAFPRLKREIEDYLSTTTGSTADLPEWLGDLDAAVKSARGQSPLRKQDTFSVTGRPLPRLRPDEIGRQFSKGTG